MNVAVSIQNDRLRELVSTLVYRRGWKLQERYTVRKDVEDVRFVITDAFESMPDVTAATLPAVLVLCVRASQPLSEPEESGPGESGSMESGLAEMESAMPEIADNVHVLDFADDTDEGTIAHRLEDAFTYIQLGLDMEAKHSLFYRAAISYSHDGIICVDRDGTVHVFNPKAAEVLGVTVDSALGKKLVSFNPTAGLARVLEQREIEIEDVISINGRRVAANRAPIFVNGDLVGAISTFQDVTQLQQYEKTIRKRLREGAFKAKVSMEDIVAESELTREAIRYAWQCGQVDATVLITGESGTGKEMFAQGIHNASLRSKGPFVAVNCAALPETLLESELFGYDEGAFTGAQRGGKEGLFEMAHGGTLFLDEIGEIPISFQTRLLRVLQEHEILRVGGRATIPVDVRIIAATNQPLQKLVADGKFRSDLFYRLFVLNLHVPPLRDRLDDIPPLVHEFIQELSAKYNKSNLHVGDGAMHQMMRHDWPGNVRELRNIIERAVIVTKEHGEVTAEWVESALYTELDVTNRPPDTAQPYAAAANAVPPSGGRSGNGPMSGSPHRRVATLAPLRAHELSAQDRELVSLYTATRSVTVCSERLGIHRTTVWRRLKRLEEQGWIQR